MEELRLPRWKIPDENASLDDLMYMLQVVQAATVVGGSLTNKEADLLMAHLVEKINKIKANS